MTKYARQWFLLSASTSLALLLGACGDARPGSEVVGARRTPVLNQEMMEGAGLAAPARAPSDLSQNAKVAAQVSPFDQYDDSGNLKSSGSIWGDDSQAPSTASDPQEKGLLDGMFNTSPSKPARVPSGTRKSFSGSESVSSPAPVMRQSAVASQDAPPPIIVAKPRDVPPVAAPVILKEPSSPPLQETQYVPLASVPQRPPRFAEIKEENQQQLQELQGDNAQAQQQRQDLYAEPSELVPSPPAAEVAAPVAIAPAPAMFAPVAAPAASAPGANYADLPSPLILQQKRAIIPAQ